MTDKRRDKAAESLDSALKNLIRTDLEEAKSIIKEAGFDVEKEIANGLKFIKKLEFQSQAVLNAQSSQQLYEKAFKKLKALIGKGYEASGETLLSLLKSREPSFQFRNLEKLGDEEIKEILGDIDLIKLIEEIEKENQK